jgi:hypothetical protein
MPGLFVSVDGYRFLYIARRKLQPGITTAVLNMYSNMKVQEKPVDRIEYVREMPASLGYTYEMAGEHT